MIHGHHVVFIIFSLSGKPSDLFEKDSNDWAPSQKLHHSKLRINVKSSQERAKRRQNSELTRVKKRKSVHKKLFAKSTSPVGSPVSCSPLLNKEIANVSFFPGASDLEHQTHSTGEDKMSETSNSNINCQTDLSGEHRILDVSNMQCQTDSTSSRHARGT